MASRWRLEQNITSLFDRLELPLIKESKSWLLCLTDLRGTSLISAAKAALRCSPATPVS